ncbi:MAG: hypothetical protein US70_C0039G0003 [Parcubacteria group bacterium GW2011_GWD2_38_11]|nr:MAG: hypothetical protein US70_C0039G0003 [Parcubacteria group bacterium GW2011_GWD2_38_11]
MIRTVQELIENAASFREFVEDLFPNDIVDDGIVNAIEKNLLFDPAINNCDRLDVLVFLSEINTELKKEYPVVFRLLTGKLYLAAIFGKQDVVKVLEEEQVDMLNFDLALSSQAQKGSRDEEGWSVGEAVWDPDEKSTPHEK